MKIKSQTLSTADALKVETPKRKLKKPSFLFQSLVRLLSIGELCKANFRCEKENMKKAGKGPWLILMNHTCFLDLKMASKLLYPKRHFIVSTADALIGKEWLMRNIGCIPTEKFVTDPSLARNLKRALTQKKTSVLMYPEAGYTFDGRTTLLPDHLGAFVKYLGAPLVMITSKNAFLYQPLYNNLHTRKVPVCATMECLLSQEELAEKSAEEIQEIILKAFSFDAFKTQRDEKIKIDEPYRAEGLHRILYRCPHCNTDGQTVGEGVTLTCNACGKAYEMDEYGQMRAKTGETEFCHIPDWVDWERTCVREELKKGEYRLETEVDIVLSAGFKAVYPVGKGKLVHDENGFALQSDDGVISYTQSPLFSYSVNADFYWYETADIVCIGDKKRLYYCLLPDDKNAAAKTRYAAEELYKMKK